MQIFFYTYIFIIWTLFWSFTSVIIDRIKNKKLWIIFWKSECPQCKHKLKAIDLIPIFSFLLTKWKCRYCRKKISLLYPILEISTWILFIISTYFLIDINLILSFNWIEIYKLLFFLLFAFLTIIYVYYDILYLEIPDIIIIILIWITFITISLQSLIPNFFIINILPVFNNEFTQKQILQLITFWAFMIWSFYFIMLKWLKEIYDVLIIFLIILWFIIIKYNLEIDIEKTAIWGAILWSFCLFLFLFLQILISWWKWIWGGDLRIVILMWLVVWLNFAIHTILLSYLFWSIIWIIIIIFEKTKNYYKTKKNIISRIKKILWLKESKIELNTKMPFGPFLAIWMYLILFFNIFVNELIKKIFLL